MLRLISRLPKFRTAIPGGSRLPSEVVIQAIGDVHGCAHLLGSLLRKLDLVHQNYDHKLLIVLGDLIDRGSDSKGVIEKIITEKERAPDRQTVVALRGNHEQLFLNFLKDPEGSGPQWLKFGGTETLKSYGVHPPRHIDGAKLRYCKRELLQKMSAEHLSFLESMPLSHTSGDYFFCHAGVSPHRGLGRQAEQDLLWSRTMDFLDETRLEKIIVHGHVPVEEPVSKVGHINVDTGAFATGQLTALSICGSERQFVSVGG